MTKIKGMEPLVPEHMDRWARNQRLYETLKGMGLYVVPIPEIDDPSKIAQLVVSADLPPDMSRVGVPVQRPQVTEVVVAAARDGDNVLHFLPTGQ